MRHLQCYPKENILLLGFCFSERKKERKKTINAFWSLQVFSWRSLDDILFVIIPFIDSTMAVEQDIIDTSSNTTAVADSRTKLAQLLESKNGWQKIVDRNDELFVQAKAGKLVSVTHLVANALLQDSNGVDNVKFINGSKSPNADKLREISAIKFVYIIIIIIIASLFSSTFLFAFTDLFYFLSCSKLWRIWCKHFL